MERRRGRGEGRGENSWRSAEWMTVVKGVTDQMGFPFVLVGAAPI